MISLNSDKLKFTGVTLDNPRRTVIPQGLTAVVGPNGAGKSTLGKILEGGWNFMTNDISAQRRLTIKIIEFSDIHALTGFKSLYYQQRYESGINLETPTVGELLGDKLATETWARLSEALNLAGIVDKRVNCLSSGELRKLLIANMMFDLPDVLILDNPYIGLDAASRPVLDAALRAIVSHGLSVILLVSDSDEVPEGAHVIAMDALVIAPGNVAPGAPGNVAPDTPGINIAPRATDASNDLDVAADSAAEPVVEMRGVTVNYGGRVILDNIDWTIRRGECWSLSGPNGSGKSTLLSLINADNPQAYCNNIRLFGRRRGSGESIWDIKSRIAYVSPEMHLYFQGYSHTLREVVAAGLRDTVGFYRLASDIELTRADEWLSLLGMGSLAQQRFATLSYGQQRLGLLARTFVKAAELMILDEPLHGLDLRHKQMVRSLIDAEVRRRGCTLIYVTHCPAEIPACVTKSYVLRP